MLKVRLHKYPSVKQKVDSDTLFYTVNTHEELRQIAQKAREIEHHISILTERRDVFFEEQDKSFSIQVDSKSMMEASLLVFMDKKKVTDALFIHGSSVKDLELDNKILTLGAKLLHEGAANNLVINGVSQEICTEKGLAYPGAEPWRSTLESLGVSYVHYTQPSLHTAEESANLVDLALWNNWSSVTIMALPHHLLRCMCQIVYFLQQKNATHIKVYARTLDDVDWLAYASKPVLGTGKSIEGTLYDHIEAEFQRIEKYMDPTGKGYTPHATLEEVIEYIKNRDSASAA
jgi:hypothetical protein